MMWKSRYKSGTNEIRLNTHEREEAVLRVLHRLSPHDQERIHEHFFNGVASLTTEQIHTFATDSQTGDESCPRNNLTQRPRSHYG